MKVLKAELFRVRRDYTYWIFLISVIGLVLFNIFGLIVIRQYFPRLPQDMLEELKMIREGREYYNFGIFQVEKLEQIKHISVTNVLSEFTASNSIVALLAIFVPFYAFQYRRRVVEYLLVSRYSNYQILSGGILSVLVLVNIILGIYIGGLSAFAGIFRNSEEEAGLNIARFFIWYLKLDFNICAFALLIFALAFFIKSYAGNVVVSMMLTTTGGLITKIMGIFFENPDLFTKCWVLNNVSGMTFGNFNISDVRNSILVAAVTMLLSIGFVLLEIHFNKGECYR